LGDLVEVPVAHAETAAVFLVNQSAFAGIMAHRPVLLVVKTLVVAAGVRRLAR